MANISVEMPNIGVSKCPVADLFQKACRFWNFSWAEFKKGGLLSTILETICVYEREKISFFEFLSTSVIFLAFFQTLGDIVPGDRIDGAILSLIWNQLTKQLNLPFVLF